MTRKRGEFKDIQENAVPRRGRYAVLFVKAIIIACGMYWDSSPRSPKCTGENQKEIAS
jgi:hypothetical protein